MRSNIARPSRPDRCGLAWRLLHDLAPALNWRRASLCAHAALTLPAKLIPPRKPRGSRPHVLCSPTCSPSKAALRSSPAAARGSGASAPRRLLSAGARVLIASRKAEVCEAAAKELSEIGPCEGFGGTVHSEAGVAALADEVRRRTGELHILVNNAGVSWGEPYETYPWKAFDRVLARQRHRPVPAHPRTDADAARGGAAPSGRRASSTSAR